MFQKLIFLLLLLGLGTKSYSIGWYPARTIDRGVNSFAVFKPGTNSSNIYIVTESLAGAFRKNQPNQAIIKIFQISGSAIRSSTVARVTLDASPTPFPLHPRVAAFSSQVLVTWQETSYERGGTAIKYAYSPSGINSFSAPQNLPGTEPGKTSILPVVSVDDKGKFQVYFQQEQDVARFTLMQSIGERGVFAEPRAIVKGIQFIGRGVFFPTVVFRNQ